jgi:hypothetical protein
VIRKEGDGSKKDRERKKVNENKSRAIPAGS